MFRCLQTKKAPPARLYCLIDGAKVGRKILLGEKRDGKGKLRKVNRKVGTKKLAVRKETVKLP